MKNAALTIIAGFVAAFTFGQGSAIKGKVLDSDGLPVSYVNVYVEVGGTPIGDVTDMDGNFKISGLDGGTYNLTISSIAYSEHTITGVIVEPDKLRLMGDITLGSESFVMGGVVVWEWEELQIDPEDAGKQTMKAVEIEKHAGGNNFLSLLSSMSSDIVILEGSDQVMIRGSRPSSLMYFIDGVKQSGSLSGMIGSSIGSITTYTGGIPAKYGDTTGGVIAVETKSYFDLYAEYNAELLLEENSDATLLQE